MSKDMLKARELVFQMESLRRGAVATQNALDEAVRGLSTDMLGELADYSRSISDSGEEPNHIPNAPEGSCTPQQ